MSLPNENCPCPVSCRHDVECHGHCATTPAQPEKALNDRINDSARSLPEGVKALLRVIPDMTMYLAGHKHASGVIANGMSSKVESWELALDGFAECLRGELAQPAREWVSDLGFELKEEQGVWLLVDDCGNEREATLTERVLWDQLIEKNAGQPAADDKAGTLFNHETLLQIGMVKGLSMASDDKAGGPFADFKKAGWEKECDDTDKLLEHLGLDPALCRTDGGWLNLPRIKELLEAEQAKGQEAVASIYMALYGNSVGVEFGHSAKHHRLDDRWLCVEFNSQEHAMAARDALKRLSELARPIISPDEFTHPQPQAEAVRVPEGYALVPVEPTSE